MRVFTEIALQQNSVIRTAASRSKQIPGIQPQAQSVEPLQLKNSQTRKKDRYSRFTCFLTASNWLGYDVWSPKVVSLLTLPLPHPLSLSLSLFVPCSTILKVVSLSLSLSLSSESDALLLVSRRPSHCCSSCRRNDSHERSGSRVNFRNLGWFITVWNMGCTRERERERGAMCGEAMLLASKWHSSQLTTSIGSNAR